MSLHLWRNWLAQSAFTRKACRFESCQVHKGSLSRKGQYDLRSSDFVDVCVYGFVAHFVSNLYYSSE